MTTIWKVSTNYKFFDYKKAQDDYKSLLLGNRKTPVLIYQSKGKARMVNIPKKGHKVYLSCAKKEVLIGEIIEDFNDGIMHHTCPYNKGKLIDASHREPASYCIIKITAIGNESELKGVQRTWSKYSK